MSCQVSVTEGVGDVVAMVSGTRIHGISIGRCEVQLVLCASGVKSARAFWYIERWFDARWSYSALGGRCLGPILGFPG
jgi:hypothetical protein